MTSFYRWRLMFMTFYGEPRGDHHAHDHAHESPMVMLIPLGVLALGAVFSGMIWYKVFFGDETRCATGSAWPRRGAAHAEAASARAEATPRRRGRCRGRQRPTMPRPRRGAATEAAGGRGRTASAAAADAAVARRRWRRQGAIFIGPDNHVINAGARGAELGQGLALRRHADRLRAGLAVLHPRPEPAAAAWPRSSGRSTCSC